MLVESDQPAIGKQLPDFQLPDLNGNLVSLSQSAHVNGAVIAFICNHCPYVQSVIERLVKDANELKTLGIETLAVMSNDYRAVPSDSPQKMHEFSERYQLNFPYLLDEDQNIARKFSAVCTPDFFAVNKNLELIYRGRLDNLTRPNHFQTREPELLNAIKSSVAGGSPIPAENQLPSIGCSIKWKVI